MKFIIDLFRIEKQPRKGLMPLEWVTLGYLAVTLAIVLFAYTKVANPDSMIWGRVRIGAMTLALWVVYRMMPCRFTRLTRVLAQLVLLSWWYPDTYEINRMFPNLDHLFAQWEQDIFGFQPALVFCQRFPSHVFSELMDLGYASYYPMIMLVVMFYFIFRYKEFERASTIIITSFFIYYLIFILVPVTGPTFYFKAVGVDQIAHGVFPNVHDYFNFNTSCLPSPGFKDGIFYNLVEGAKAAGERPTAAFPSSHVGMSTILLLLAWHSGSRRLFTFLIPFYVLLCFSTVYIQAHYAIDAIAGLITGTLTYFILILMTHRMKGKSLRD